MNAVSLTEFGVKVDTEKNNYFALQEALNSGELLTAPRGRIKYSQTLQFPEQFGGLKGAGSSYWSNGGTVFQYTGTGDAMRHDCELNASNATRIVLEDFVIQTLAPQQGKAGFVSVAATLPEINRVSIDGFNIGCILEQAEVAKITRLLVRGEATQIGLWVPDKEGYSPGGQEYRANRISIEHSNFNVAGVGIALDGGFSYDITKCNFYAGQKNIRAANIYGLLIADNYFEEATVYHIELTDTARGGASAGLCHQVEVRRNFHGSHVACTMLKSNAQDLAVFSNSYNSQHADAVPMDLDLTKRWEGKGNEQVGIGGSQAAVNKA